MTKLPPPAEAIAAHEELRDLVASIIHREWDVPISAFSIVAVKLLGFGFNTYKAIGLLLPDRHYEPGTALLRTLWETCANFAWIQQQPEERAGKFLGFTAIEFRKFAQRAMPFETEEERVAFIRSFDSKLGSFIESYQSLNRKGRQRWAERFTGGKLDSMIRDLPSPWPEEYRTLYPLACHYTHGSPGAILFPVAASRFDSMFEIYRQPDDQRTVQLALWSMALVVRLVNGFLAWTETEPIAPVAALEDRFGFSASLLAFSSRP